MSAVTGERVERALILLGETSAEVARTLREEGITGPPGKARLCPVAQYLCREFNAHYVCVFLNAYVQQSATSDDVECRTPEPVYEFIKDFDHGAYPELEDR